MLLQSATPFFYYKVRWSVITKCDSFFITKCDKCYYKVRQVLQSVTILLHSATGITKCDDYYKVRQYTREGHTRRVSPTRARFFWCPLSSKRTQATIVPKSGRGRRTSQRQVVVYERFQLQGFNRKNVGVLYRWSLTRGGRPIVRKTKITFTDLKFGISRFKRWEPPPNPGEI